MAQLHVEASSILLAKAFSNDFATVFDERIGYDVTEDRRSRVIDLSSMKFSYVVTGVAFLFMYTLFDVESLSSFMETLET